MLHHLLQVFRETGVFASVLLLAALAGAAVAGTCGLVEASGRRVPGAVWGVLPAGCVVAGCLVTAYNNTHLLMAIHHIDPTQRVMIANAGLSEELGALIIAFGGSGMVLLFSAAVFGLARLFGKTRGSAISLSQTALAAGALGMFAVSGLAACVGVATWTETLRAVAYADPAALAVISGEGVSRAMMIGRIALAASGVGGALALIATARQIGQRPTQSLVLNAAAGGLLVFGVVASLAVTAAVCAPAADVADVQ